MKREISFHKAKKMAEEAIAPDMKTYLSYPDQEYFSENVLEADNAWMFLKNEEIIMELPKPKTGGFISTCSSAIVSKKGEIRLFSDWGEDIDKAKEYLQILSDLFKQKNL